MADRAAAERACKDPNPNIDGRKANVNLAYLGAKPRNLQPGESVFPFLALLGCYIQRRYLGDCGVEKAPPVPWPRSGSRLSCARRAVTGQSSLSSGLDPFFQPRALVGQGVGGASSSCQLSSREEVGPRRTNTRGPWPASAELGVHVGVVWEGRGSCFSLIQGVGMGGFASLSEAEPPAVSRFRLCHRRPAAAPHLGPAHVRVSGRGWWGWGQTRPSGP